MNDATDVKDIKIDPLYLLKIVTGLALLGILIAIANSAPLIDNPALQQLLLAGLVLLSIGIIPFVKYFYKRADELQQLLHQYACVTSLSVVITISCVIGTLQASNIIPLFNQFWTMGLSIGVWGLFLMLSDRSYK